LEPIPADTKQKAKFPLDQFITGYKQTFLIIPNLHTVQYCIEALLY